MTGRRGEHVVASFLCSQGWHPVIADAEGYDIIFTFQTREGLRFFWPTCKIYTKNVHGAKFDSHNIVKG